MRRSLLVLLLVTGCDREADQRARCAAFAEQLARPDADRWIEQCVTERWSNKQMECHARTGGMQAMFCDE